MPVCCKSDKTPVVTPADPVHHDDLVDQVLDLGQQVAGHEHSATGRGTGTQQVPGGPCPGPTRWW
jgi:hypothetical protein